MPPTPGTWRVERGINDFDIVVGYGRLAGYIQREADADVMAASKSLLATARDFVALYDNVSDLVNSDIKAKLARARKAIAKAEGRA